MRFHHCSHYFFSFSTSRMSVESKAERRSTRLIRNTFHKSNDQCDSTNGPPDYSSSASVCRSTGAGRLVDLSNVTWLPVRFRNTGKCYFAKSLGQKVSTQRSLDSWELESHAAHVTDNKMYNLLYFKIHINIFHTKMWALYPKMSSSFPLSMAEKKDLM